MTDMPGMLSVKWESWVKNVKFHRAHGIHHSATSNKTLSLSKNRNAVSNTATLYWLIKLL